MLHYTLYVGCLKLTDNLSEKSNLFEREAHKVIRTFSKEYEMYAEKRINYRFSFRDDVFISFGHQFVTVGKIRDISLGGLSFTYRSNEELSSEPYRVLDLFTKRSGLHTQSIACKVVYYINENTWNTNSPMTLPATAKKCGIKFKNLTYNQTVQLAYLISKIQF